MYEKQPNQIKIETSIDKDYLNIDKNLIKNDDNDGDRIEKDDDIGLRKNSNTKATLSQEIKFNNQEIEKLTSKINNHLDVLNQSSSSSSSASNHKRSIPKSPHSSFDLNALNDDIDNNSSETDDDIKYLSKSIEITGNILINENNNKNVDDINTTSQMKEESLYDFIHTTLDNFDEINNDNNDNNNIENNNNEKDQIDINNNVNENNLEDIKNEVHAKEG
jgi:hypothetical protein